MTVGGFFIVGLIVVLVGFTVGLLIAEWYRDGSYDLNYRIDDALNSDEPVFRADVEATDRRLWDQ